MNAGDWRHGATFFFFFFFLPGESCPPRLPRRRCFSRRSGLRRICPAVVRERLSLPGFDPDEAVPAIAIHPASGGPFPWPSASTGSAGRRKISNRGAATLAARGIFAVTIDAHLHGERSIAGIFHGDNIASLGGEYSIWVHQTVHRPHGEGRPRHPRRTGPPARRRCHSGRCDRVSPWDPARPWSSPGASPASASWRASSGRWISGGT